MRHIFLIIGFLSALYGAVVWAAFSGSSFFLFWFALSAVCIVTGLGGAELFLSHAPGWLLLCLRILVILGIVSFVWIETMIVSFFPKRLPPHLSYIIVPGALVFEDGPSVVLRYRLDAAAAYLRENEETVVIVSGGQGPNEPFAESTGMRAYLEASGIDSKRILEENRAVNTAQNMAFSVPMLSGAEEAGVITNNFHLMRAMRLAERAGIGKVYGTAAPSSFLYLPNNMAREYFGVVKDVLAGNMKLW